MLIFLLLSCRDPVLSPIREALVLYDQGQGALQAGDYPAARQAFAAARKQADSAALAAWEATSLEQQGQVDQAIDVLSRAIEIFPHDPTLRYNRAALTARSGDLDTAAIDLRLLIEAGQIDPLEAGADPDFAAFAMVPELAPLAPPPALEVTGTAEDGAVLLGEEWDLELLVDAPADALLSLTPRGSPNPQLQLERVLEDTVRRERRRSVHRLAFTWRATQAGTSIIGPWAIQAARLDALVPSYPVEVVALGPRKAAPAQAPGLDQVLPVPSTLLGAHEPPWIGAAESWAVALQAPHHRLELHDASGQRVTRRGIRLEYRETNQTRWIAHAFPLGSQLRARILAGGQVILEDSLP